MPGMIGRKALEDLLSPGDLRTTGNVHRVMKLVRTEKDFNALFSLMWSGSRPLALRAADAVEKITFTNPRLLAGHEDDLLEMASRCRHGEILWHLAQLLGRLTLHAGQRKKARALLTRWCLDKSGSRIARVNSLQSLWDLSRNSPAGRAALGRIIAQIRRENVPSLTARIKKLQASEKCQPRS